MEKIKVTNMESPRTGCKVANQYTIKVGNKLYFQSYDTVVACIESVGRAGEVTLVQGATEFSRTTSKYLYKFLEENSLINTSYLSRKGIAELIKRGDIREVKEL